jgi:hypothetical protein
VAYFLCVRKSIQEVSILLSHYTVVGGWIDGCVSFLSQIVSQSVIIYGVEISWAFRGIVIVHGRRRHLIETRLTWVCESRYLICTGTNNTNGCTTAVRLGHPTVNSHFWDCHTWFMCSFLGSPTNCLIVLDMDPLSIPSNPPPAYAEQDFDQKISQATTLSLSQPTLTIDSDGWPLYDPAAFEATEGSSTSPSTSTAERSSSGTKDDYMQHGSTIDLPSVVPLRIEKKTQPKSLPNPPAQPKNENTSLTIGENPAPTFFSSETSNHDDSRTQHHSAQSRYEQDTASLIPLTPAQNSTQISHKRDASPPPPPFESEPPTSIPESRPIAYDHDNHYQQYLDPYNITPSQSARQFQSRSRLVPQERPEASYSSAPNTIQPSYLDFNPSIAYTQPAAPSLPLIQPVKKLQFDPHAFYKYATIGSQG